MTFSAQFNLSDLNGSNGFVLNGIDEFDRSGGSVDGVGDINGDGIDDLIIGALYADNTSGESYVVFGSDQGFDPNLNLSDLNGGNGFVLNGIDGSGAGGSVSGAGDINGDGIDDLIIGAPYADPNGNDSGESHVVFGSDQGFAASLDLADLDGSNGFVLNGVDMFDRSGGSVDGVGDINGDGFDDLIIGADSASPNGNSSGQSYVVFGNDQGFAASVELADLDGSNGFVLNGIAAGDDSGVSVSGVGDINGDGFDDLIIGANSASPNGNNSGQSYVVFGNDQDFAASVELADLDGSNGFVLNGIAVGDDSGGSVSGAGDINGDGFDDLIIGAREADPNGNFRAGESYVVFGSNQGFAASLNLSDLDGRNGFVLNGIDLGDLSGGSVSGAGDINGDGFDDLIIGAIGADPNGSYSGESYVVFGSDQGFATSLNLSTLNGSNGFVLNGIAAGNSSGDSVSGAGDINGDGFDDLIIGASGANGRTGESYVVFGRPSPTNGDDVLTGTDSPDVIFALAGNDRVSGLGGNDRLAGEAGNDRLFGGDNNDRLLGGTGNDTAVGGTGNDRLLGGTGRDRLVGGDGIDTLLGSSDNDALIGGAGNDRLFGQGGNDLMRGNLGNDVLNGGAGNDRQFGGAGNDRLNGQGGNDVLRGGSGTDVLRGGNGNDRLAGELGNDVIVTGAGRDRIVIRSGQGVDRVTDFTDGQDRIVLGGINFGQLSIQQRNNDVLISRGNQRLLLLKNTNVGNISEADFA